MTVAAMRESMSNDEYLQWRALAAVRAAEQELAMKKMEAARGRR